MDAGSPQPRRRLPGHQGQRPAGRADWDLAGRTFAGPAAVAEVAAETGATNHRVVLARLLHQSAPRVVPLIGPRTPQQLEDALPALRVKFTGEQLSRLDDAGA